MSSEVFIDGLRDAYNQGDAEGFLLEQHERLAETTRPIDFIGAGSKVTYNYIHPESRIQITLNTKGFRVNDPNALIDFGEAVLTISQRDDEVTSDRLVIDAAQYAMFKYYSIGDSPVDEKVRMKFHPRFLKGKTRDLHEVRESGTAMCSERAALSHNFTTLGGLPTAFATGMMGPTPESARPHATQIVRVDDEFMLFDSANPSVRVSNGRTTLVPTTAVVDPYKTLVDGLPQAVRMSREYDTGTYVMDVEFTHTALYPATFEGFDKLGRLGKAAIANMSNADKRKLGIEDAAERLQASKFMQV